MLTLLVPCTLNRTIPGLTQSVDRVFFTAVFRENNNEVRIKFFSEPLIKYLWSKIFIEDKPDIVVDHLRRLRGHKLIGEAK